MRERPCADWRGSNCGASFFRSLSRFQTTASAVKSRAVVEFHALAQLEDPLGLVGRRSTAQLVARPGTRSDGLSALRQVPVDQPVIDRVAHEAHALAALSVWPVVSGMSEAVMPIRRTPCARAVGIRAPDSRVAARRRDFDQRETEANMRGRVSLGCRRYDETVNAIHRPNRCVAVGCPEQTRASISSERP